MQEFRDTSALRTFRLEVTQDISSNPGFTNVLVPFQQPQTSMGNAMNRTI